MATRAGGILPCRAHLTWPGLVPELVKRGDLEIERFLGVAPTPVRGDGHAVDLTADAMDLDRPRVGGWVGVDLEAPKLAGGLAAKRDHPAIVDGFGASFPVSGWGIYSSSPLANLAVVATSLESAPQRPGCPHPPLRGVLWSMARHLLIADDVARLLSSAQLAHLRREHRRPRPLLQRLRPEDRPLSGGGPHRPHRRGLRPRHLRSPRMQALRCLPDPRPP